MNLFVKTSIEWNDTPTSERILDFENADSVRGMVKVFRAAVRKKARRISITPATIHDIERLATPLNSPNPDAI